MTEYCDNCGAVIFEGANFCMKCGVKISSYGFGRLINTENIDKFHIFQELLLEDYDKYLNILIGIAKKANANYIQLKKEYGGNILEMDPLLQISIIALSFCEVNSDESVANLDNYFFNLISVDTSYDNSHQIISFIHQLSNHLFAEIFKSLLSESLEINKDNSIEAFTAYSLRFRDPDLIDEACAYAVLKKFIPEKYIDYTELNELYTDDEDIENFFILGNTFANDIFMILNPFIDNNLKDKIKVQLAADYPAADFEKPLFDGDLMFSDNAKYSIVFHFFETAIGAALTGTYDADLDNLKKGFKIINDVRENSPLL